MTARRTLHASRWERALATIALVALGGPLIADLVGATDAGWLRTGLLGVATALVALWCVQAWRWRVVADDAGLELQPGLGRPRRVTWDDVDHVRAERPGAVALRGGDEIRLDGATGPPVHGRQLEELDHVVDDALARR